MTAVRRAPVLRTGLAFFMNGVAATIWLPRTPLVPDRLGTSAGRLGVAFAVMGVGGIVGSRLAPWLIRRHPPARVMAVVGLVLAVGVSLRAVPTALGGFLAVQALVGLADGVHDVAMNAEGVRLDAALRRSIMNRLHGVWSVGALLGGAIGSALASLGVGFAAHMLIGGILVAGLNLPLLVAFRETPAFLASASTRTVGSRISVAIVVLAAVGSAAALSEAAPTEWGPLYLRVRLGTSEGVAGLATVAFAAAMVLSRFSGDHAVERFGPMRVLFAGAVMSVVGLAAGIGIDRPWSVIAGWALIGAGIASAFPALFVAGSRLPGVPPEVGMGAITSVARFGFLVGPLVVGAFVDSRGVRSGLVFVLAVMVAMAAGSRWLMRQAGRTTISM